MDPFFNKETFKASKPEYELPKKKERTEEHEQQVAKLIDNIKHVDLYEYEDEDVYRQMISDTVEMRVQRMVHGHISKVFMMKEIQEAVDFILQKQCTGKVLVDVKCEDDDKCEDEKGAATQEEKKKDD